MYVIGYKYKGFDEAFLKHHNLTLDELIGSKLELKFAVCVDKHTVKETNSDDIFDQMITENYGMLESFENEVAIIYFKHKIPFDIYKRYYDSEPIYENES